MAKRAKVPNTKFNYLYRDASNYKSYGSIVLTGPMTDPSLVDRLMEAFETDGLFIPAQIGVPKVDFETTGEFPPNEDDHPWHEFESMEPTTEKATDKRTPEQFVCDVEKVGREGWDGTGRS